MKFNESSFYIVLSLLLFSCSKLYFENVLENYVIKIINKTKLKNEFLIK